MCASNGDGHRWPRAAYPPVLNAIIAIYHDLCYYYIIHRISKLVTHHKILLIIRERGSVHFEQWNTQYGIWIIIWYVCEGCSRC